MGKFVAAALLGVTALTYFASSSGWGLDKPVKQAKSVREGSRRKKYSHHGFYYIGRSHSYHSGK